ncbi:unnamed protein product [Brassica oleracea]
MYRCSTRYGRFLLVHYRNDYMPLGSQPGPKVSNFPSHSPMSTILKSQPLRKELLLHNLVSLGPLRKVWWIRPRMLSRQYRSRRLDMLTLLQWDFLLV